MASLKVGFFLLAIFLFSSPVLVHCDGDEEDLLKCLNCHRAYLDLPTLIENQEAGCLAGEVAQKLEEQPCNGSSNPFEVDQYPELLSRCDININHTRDGVILPVCVTELVATVVFTNYTRTHFAKYINDSKFSEAGVGSKGDWMVVVLSTNDTGGDFAGASSNLVSNVSFGRCLVSFLLGLLCLF